MCVCVCVLRVAGVCARASPQPALITLCCCYCVHREGEREGGTGIGVKSGEGLVITHTHAHTHAAVVQQCWALLSPPPPSSQWSLLSWIKRERRGGGEGDEMLCGTSGKRSKNNEWRDDWAQEKDTLGCAAMCVCFKMPTSPFARKNHESVQQLCTLSLTLSGDLDTQHLRIIIPFAPWGNYRESLQSEQLAKMNTRELNNWMATYLLWLLLCTPP